MSFPIETVPDYRLDPPDEHDWLCSCEECDAYHEDEREAFWNECRRCQEVVLGDIAVGVRCCHGFYVPGRITDITCALCEDYYGRFK